MHLVSTKELLQFRFKRDIEISLFLLPVKLLRCSRCTLHFQNKGLATYRYVRLSQPRNTDALFITCLGIAIRPPFLFSFFLVFKVHQYGRSGVSFKSRQLKKSTQYLGMIHGYSCVCQVSDQCMLAHRRPGGDCHKSETWSECPVHKSSSKCSI